MNRALAAPATQQLDAGILAAFKRMYVTTLDDRQARIDDATEGLQRLCASDLMGVVGAALEAHPDLTDEQLDTLSNFIGRVPHNRKRNA